MPKFFFIARDSSGQKTTGFEDAAEQEELITRMQAKGMTVIEISSADINEQIKASLKSGPGSVKPKATRMHNGVKGEDLVLFCRQLATLLGSGITILKSLDTISKQIASRKLYNAVQDISKNMEAGVTFHEAVAKHSKIFPELWVNVIESGEASGSLAVVLERLATYLERNQAFQKKIISALVYPMILAVAGTGAILFMTIKIIPTFAELFKGFNMQLPPLTQVLVNISTILRKYFIVIIAVFGLGIFALKKYVSTREGRSQFDRLKFKLPVFGSFFRILVIERFTSTMSTLLESGVPILYSLEIVEHSVGNTVAAAIIRQVKDDVREGKTIGPALEKSAFFEPMVVQMVSIGEEIGELPNMFKRLNLFYQEYVETFLTRLTTMFEPIMLLFMAAVIGIMIVGMFLPIFQIASMGG